MSNMIAFRMAEERAKRAEEKRQTFSQDISIEIPAQTVLFASQFMDNLRDKIVEQTAYIKQLEKLAGIRA